MKIDEYIGFCVHRRSYLLGSPVILETVILTTTGSAVSATPLGSVSIFASCLKHRPPVLGKFANQALSPWGQEGNLLPNILPLY